MTSRFTINGLSFDASDSSATRVSWQIAQRIQLVVNQVTRQKAGAPVGEIAADLNRRLRRMGVNANVRELNEYADRIAKLPPN